MRAILLTLALTACVPIPILVPTFSQPPARSLPENAAPDASFHAQMQSVRSRPIAYNTRLAAVARAHAQDMETRGYFDHVSPNDARAQDRAAANGLPTCGIGENIGQGQKTSDAVFTAWMASGAHRRNMLNPSMASYGLGRAGDSWVLMLYTPC